MIYIYKTVMFDRVFALGRVRIPAPASDMSCPTGPRNRRWFFVDQIVDPGIIEITLHVQSRVLVKCDLWQAGFGFLCGATWCRTFFADFLFVGRSVGNSRVCRVKSFEIQQSTRIDRIARNPYTLPVKKKDLRNYRSWRGSRRTTRKKTRSKLNGDWESTPVPSRQAGDRETRSSYPSLWGVTAENSTKVYFTNAVPFFPWIVEGTAFAWGGWPLLLKVVLRRTKDQKRSLYLIKLFLFLLRRR